MSQPLFLGDLLGVRGGAEKEGSRGGGLPSAGGSERKDPDTPPAGGGGGEPKVPENDFLAFLAGTWKRNLEWREFGASFRHLRTNNTIVVIEETAPPTAGKEESRARFIKWSFGKTMQRKELRFGYVMKCWQSPKTFETFFEWTYKGTVCHGKYMWGAGVAVFNFILRFSVVVVTYRVMDVNSMAVCIVEIGRDESPTVQYGNMFRLDADLYGSLADETGGASDSSQGRYVPDSGGRHDRGEEYPGEETIGSL